MNVMADLLYPKGPNGLRAQAVPYDTNIWVKEVVELAQEVRTMRSQS
jgi:hypothetical protein